MSEPQKININLIDIINILQNIKSDTYSLQIGNEYEIVFDMNAKVTRDLESRTFTIEENGTNTYTPSPGYNGFEKVKIITNVNPPLETKQKKLPSLNPITINTSENYYGMESVTVTPVTPVIFENDIKPKLTTLTRIKGYDFNSLTDLTTLTDIIGFNNIDFSKNFTNLEINITNFINPIRRYINPTGYFDKISLTLDKDAMISSVLNTCLQHLTITTTINTASTTLNFTHTTQFSGLKSLQLTINVDKDQFYLNEIKPLQKILYVNDVAKETVNLQNQLFSDQPYHHPESDLFIEPLTDNKKTDYCIFHDNGTKYSTSPYGVHTVQIDTKAYIINKNCKNFLGSIYYPGCLLGYNDYYLSKYNAALEDTTDSSSYETTGYIIGDIESFKNPARSILTDNYCTQLWIGITGAKKTLHIPCFAKNYTKYDYTSFYTDDRGKAVIPSGNIAILFMMNNNDNSFPKPADSNLLKCAILILQNTDASTVKYSFISAKSYMDKIEDIARLKAINRIYCVQTYTGNNDKLINLDPVICFNYWNHNNHCLFGYYRNGSSAGCTAKQISVQSEEGTTLSGYYLIPFN